MKQRAKIRAILQKEVNSICPFCDNTDVEHFEIHHIDENHDNDVISNLILICPTCHSKITKGDITQRKVRETKNELPFRNTIEFISVKINKKSSGWEKCEDEKYSFYNSKYNVEVDFPIFEFVFINQSTNTILLTEIQLKAEKLELLPYGHGQPVQFVSEPRIILSLEKYKIEIPKEDEITRLPLHDEIEIPPKKTLKFEVQPCTIDQKLALYFSFLFSNNNIIKAPTIYLNCKSENEYGNSYEE